MISIDHALKMIILEFPNVDILEYLRKELVDHDRVENDDEHKGEEVAKDEETGLRKRQKQTINTMLHVI